MKELKLFLSQPHNTRILLITSLIYAFVLPVVDIFVAAYIMRNSSEAGRVVLYQLMVEYRDVGMSLDRFDKA